MIALFIASPGIANAHLSSLKSESEGDCRATATVHRMGAQRLDQVEVGTEEGETEEGDTQYPLIHSGPLMIQNCKETDWLSLVYGCLSG